jgi:NAD(P)-dependent dehydrogenase (short-subunit alcohol dehydrogenase family)
MPEDPILKDRVILVTGATGGLGQILRMAFARAGATVVLHGRVVRKLEALFDRIVEAGGPEPAILPLDFEKAGEDAFQSAASAVDAQLGRLDALVHCAATLRRLAPIEYHSMEDWSSVLRVNLSAPAALTRALLPALRRSSAGTVIFTLDSRGHEPAAYWGSYAAAKAGVEALVKVLQRVVVPLLLAPAVDETPEQGLVGGRLAELPPAAAPAFQPHEARAVASASFTSRPSSITAMA